MHPRQVPAWNPGSGFGTRFRNLFQQVRTTLLGFNFTLSASHPFKLREGELLATAPLRLVTHITNLDTSN
jgi:hypothetical protein